MKATAYMGISLDGFIARENGDLDWLHAGGQGDEDYGYKAFMATVDAVVMGRHTYEKVLTFGRWPYDKPVVVLTSRELAVPAELQGTVEVMSGPPLEILTRLAARGMGHAYVDGGRTVQAFLKARAIQRLVITRVPVLIGRGIPLFGPLSRDIRLRHVATRQYPDGLVQSEYVVLE